MEPAEPQPSLPFSHRHKPSYSLDVLSKSAAVFALLLYGCGYLITSIYYSSYGFIEVNPLRPRIVAAGGWFVLFIAMPFALVNILLSQKERWQNPDTRWGKTSRLLSIYCTASFGLSSMFRLVFDIYKAPAVPMMRTWQPAAIFIAFIVLCVILIFINTRRTFPKYVSAIFWILLAASIVGSGASDLFVAEHFNSNAIILWFFGIGLAVLLEMNSRSWKLQIGYWPQTFFWILGSLLIFATFYYPHIKSSLGGGTPIPVTIYFTKDSIIAPNQNVTAFLVDESDVGLYIVGKSDKRATFIPRSSVGLLYFSHNVSEFTLVKQK